MNKKMNPEAFKTQEGKTQDTEEGFALYQSCSLVQYTLGKHPINTTDLVIQEVPVAIEYNGIAYTVMMCSPSDLEMFAIGFSLTSGIIEHYRDIHDIEIKPNCNGITIEIEIANRCVAKLKAKQRSLAGVTGCGICGEQKLASLVHAEQPLEFKHQYNISGLNKVLTGLESHQNLSRHTGASHGAAYFHQNAEFEVIFEDVGRHIALDKLIGYIHKNNLTGGVICVTSRASFEMVQKTVLAGIECLFAMSAPTQMAIDLAQNLNMTLVGFCRQNRANVYTHASRIAGEISIS